MAPGPPSPKMSQATPSTQGAPYTLVAKHDLLCVSYQLHLLCVECIMGGCEWCHATAFLSPVQSPISPFFPYPKLLSWPLNYFQIRNDPMAAAVLAFSRGLVDTMIISSQSKGQNNNNKDSSLLRDFSFTVMSVVLSTQGLSTLDCLLALPMEDWSFVFATLTDDDTAMEARLLLKAAGQGFWWRQGGVMVALKSSELSTAM